MAAGWTELVKNNLVGTGRVSKGAIIGGDGTLWGKSDNFNISGDECAAAARGFVNSDALLGSGLRLEGEKYFVLQADDERIMGKQGSKGFFIFRTKQAVIIAVYAEGVQPEQCSKVAGALADYFKSIGPPSIRARMANVIQRTLESRSEKRVRIQYFSHQNSLKGRMKQWFVQNQKTSFYFRMGNFVIKIVSCLLYLYREFAECNWQNKESEYCLNKAVSRNESSAAIAQDKPSIEIDFDLLVWVDRPFGLWLAQTVVAIISFLFTLVIMYVHHRGSVLRSILSKYFLCELITHVPFLLSIPIVPLRRIFVPTFLNCWLAKLALQTALSDLNRVVAKGQSGLGHQLAIVLATVCCILLTGTCGVQHLQRASLNKLSIFKSFYFIIVTFSTVGYGDISPDYWCSQLFIIILLLVVLLALPAQLDKLGHAWTEHRKSGGSYPKSRAENEKHVVVSLTEMQAEVLHDFLTEFYSHQRLQNYFVIVMSPSELDHAAKLLLQLPLWEERVIYMHGTVLRAGDMERAKITYASAVFILATRANADKDATDYQTILRSWSVKDYAPTCPQYVMIFRPESKMHVKHAEYVVCEDEFKYAMLANNCISPGFSTFITLLLHTSRGSEGRGSSEIWHQLYGFHSGMEVYAIMIHESKLFGEFEGKSFMYASFTVHKRFGICLVGVKPSDPGATILLNPGSKYVLTGSDTCYYLAITREEMLTFVLDPSGESKIASQIAGMGTVALELQANRHFGSSAQPTPNITVTDAGGGSILPGTSDADPELGSGGSKKQPGRLGGSSPSPGRSLVSRLKRKVKKSSNAPKSSGAGASTPAGSQPLLVDGDKPPLVIGNDSEGQAHGRRASIAEVPANVDDAADKPQMQAEGPDEFRDSLATMCTSGFPSITPYIGTSATMCHLLKAKRNHCCLDLASKCEHAPYRNANAYNWDNSSIILASEHASNGLWNFIVPLRSHYRKRRDLKPVVLLLEQPPDTPFLDAIAWFPQVYYMLGSYNNLDKLLCAGINLCDYIVVVNKENRTQLLEEHAADSRTIVAVQSISRMFPRVRLITELTFSSNMRFMNFKATDTYALQQSQIEKIRKENQRERERQAGSNMAYMFRLPFSAGNVFSASMLDTLLYQAFAKNYLIRFARLLLGIDQAVGSGYSDAIILSEEDLWIRTYGRLYKKLCSSGIIPIGLYRTENMAKPGKSTAAHVPTDRSDTLPKSRSQLSLNHCSESEFHKRVTARYMTNERHEIVNLVRARMTALGLPLDEYVPNRDYDKRGQVSYVIINPSHDLELQPTDIVYIIRPSESAALSKFREQAIELGAVMDDNRQTAVDVLERMQHQATFRGGDAPLAPIDSSQPSIDGTPNK